MERWVRLAKQPKLGVIDLVDHKAKSGAAAATHSYLRQILEPRGIDFFPHCTSALRLSQPE